MCTNKGTEEARKPQQLIVKPGCLIGEQTDAVGGFLSSGLKPLISLVCVMVRLFICPFPVVMRPSHKAPLSSYKVFRSVTLGGTLPPGARMLLEIKNSPFLRENEIRQ